MKLSEIKLPKYTLGEELMSSISHGVGALLSVAALVVGVAFAVLTGDAWKVVSMAVYGSMLILLYMMSTIYHGLTPNAGKKVFRIIDHCAIFLLIAGSYTPFTLVTLRSGSGWIIFGMVWGAAVLGIMLNIIDLKKYSKLSMVCYLVMGWAVVFDMKGIFTGLTTAGSVLLVAGGLAYTLGAVVYGIGGRVKYMHSIWHFFVLAGSILHYFCILLYVIIK